MMNKLVLLGIGNVVVAVIIITAVILSTGNSGQSLPAQLANLQKTKLEKTQVLNGLKQQLKINEIDLITNIDEVKQFISLNSFGLLINKVKGNNRGIEYLLSGNDVDVLAVLYKALMNKLKIDVTRLDFQPQNKLIAELTILGAEQ